MKLLAQESSKQPNKTFQNAKQNAPATRSATKCIQLFSLSWRRENTSDSFGFFKILRYLLYLPPVCIPRPSAGRFFQPEAVQAEIV